MRDFFPLSYKYVNNHDNSIRNLVILSDEGFCGLIVAYQRGAYCNKPQHSR
jgi:hypothetical protein